MTAQTAPLIASTKATLGFVFAFLFAPLGVVLSILALKETRTGARSGYGLAVAGIVIGALGSLVWLVLVATMLTVVAGRPS
ncbi:DUF4190 domain-containing protein [Cellulomonas sp. Y8]|uniref:DUF4190 domain-containing protein n=1 Tax=Cellulomonas sp. Y8 TaxID=2591145 RepID=UPI00143DE6C6|nr:DUF4190 domain-containing protein [Cellulomonas sp. Y8]